MDWWAVQGSNQRPMDQKSVGTNARSVFSTTYRDARCHFRMTLHDCAQLIHAKVTRDAEHTSTRRRSSTRRSLDKREDARTQALLINTDQRAALESDFVLSESANNEIDQMVRGEVLRANLHDAWCSGASEREDRPEIEVVGEDNVAVLLRPTENDRVGRAPIADRGPVKGVKSRDLRVPAPRMVTGSYRSRLSSNGRERNLDLFSAPRGVAQRFRDIGLFQVGIQLQDLGCRPTGRDETDDRSHGDAQPADARLATHDRWVHRNSREFLHYSASGTTMHCTPARLSMRIAQEFVLQVARLFSESLRVRLAGG